jgi:hypothetical protein
MTSPTKDKDGDAIMRPAEPINSHHLLDNCYYVTAARLLGVTTDVLIGRIETMQIAGGIPTVAELQEFFTTAELPHRVSTHATLQAVEAAIRTLNSPTEVDYALAFRRENQTGHVVIARYNPGLMQSVRYYDYQINPDGDSAALDLAGGVQFHLFY